MYSAELDCIASPTRSDRGSYRLRSASRLSSIFEPFARAKLFYFFQAMLGNEQIFRAGNASLTVIRVARFDGGRNRFGEIRSHRARYKAICRPTPKSRVSSSLPSLCGFLLPTRVEPVKLTIATSLLRVNSAQTVAKAVHDSLSRLQEYRPHRSIRSTAGFAEPLISLGLMTTV